MWLIKRHLYILNLRLFCAKFKEYYCVLTVFIFLLFVLFFINYIFSECTYKAGCQVNLYLRCIELKKKSGKIQKLPTNYLFYDPRIKEVSQNCLLFFSFFFD